MNNILHEKVKNLKTSEERYNIAREFLQELILQIIDGKGYFAGLAFVGGTALRILYDLPRFSEDLDFCLIKKSGFEFGRFLETIKKELELYNFEIEINKGRDLIVLSEFIRFKSLLYDLGISPHKNEKLFIKLEIDSNPPKGYQTEVSVINKDFLFKVQNYDLPSLFAGKLHAFLYRKYAKGRDYYDILWFLAKKTSVNYKLLSAAAQQTNGKKTNINPEILKDMLNEKIKHTNFTHIAQDTAIFLQRKEELAFFKKEYFLGAVDKGIS